MSYPINYPTPQGANVQIFNYVSSSTNSHEWVKPQGASFVWFTLIGAGGNGDGTNGGGSGAVTNFMCPAFLIPDILLVSVGRPATTNTQIRYTQKDATGYQLLTAASGTTNGGGAMTANAFTAMGFFQSVAGQNGVTGDQVASTTTFLSGGGGNAASNIVTGNYGYSLASTAGFFQMQPIIVGLGGAGGGGAAKGGIGCGSGNLASGNNFGGNGMAVIITW